MTIKEWLQVIDEAGETQERAILMYWTHKEHGSALMDYRKNPDWRRWCRHFLKIQQYLESELWVKVVGGIKA